MFSFTPLQRRACLVLFVAIFVQDLFAQVHYLAGPLYTAPAVTRWMPYAALALAALCAVGGKVSRIALAALAALHYAGTTLNGALYTEGDTWIWLLAIAFVAIPDGKEKVESLFVGVFKLVGFCVYFFAGLHKALRPEWWSGAALSNVFLDSALINPSYQFLVSSPAVCKALCWITLAQRLLVPWGFWSSRPLVRRLCAGSLALMHYSYMVIMNLGTFSWVGVLFLAPLLLENESSPGYYRLPRPLPRLSAALAGAYAFCLVLVPAYHFAVAAGARPVAPFEAAAARGLPGFALNWGMFASTEFNRLQPIYSVETCAGRSLADDELLWSFGESKDYFRRRALKGVFSAELLDETRRGPLERKVIDAAPELVHLRRTVIFHVDHAAAGKVFDSGPQVVAECPGIFGGNASLSAAAAPGAAAPDFSAKNQEGKVVRLSGVRGRFVLLYFYPQDFTPGCTAEACSFRDQFKAVKALNTVVLGISRQSVASHRKFAATHHLPFDLLADEDASIAKAYGIRLREGTGNLDRTSVLIGTDGKVLEVYENVRPDTHAEQVLADIRKARKK